MAGRTPEEIQKGVEVANRVRQQNLRSSPVPEGAPDWMKEFDTIYVEAFPPEGEEEGVLVFMDEALHEFAGGAWKRIA